MSNKTNIGPTIRWHKIETVVGNCDNRTQGPDDEVLEGRDYMARTCPQCGAHAEPLVRNDARCTCWKWMLSCPECGHQWHE